MLHPLYHPSTLSNCSPDRLPLYEMVFEYVVAEQKPRYTKPRAPSLKDVLKEAKADNEAEEEGEEGKEKKKKKGKKKREKPEKEEKTLNEFALLQRSLAEPKVVCIIFLCRSFALFACLLACLSVCLSVSSLCL